ncbi:helix-turn-helix transcriptional regulator [Thiotrichales bacterium 19X7-9]|nr:helix-turn-helix transcriptional regulator [Thiotrichales bacterium 19X7-9]
MSKINLEHLSILGDKLFDMVNSFNTPVHIKDARTYQYIASNNANLEIYNLNSVDEIIGATVNDLDSFMKPFWGDEFARRINISDHEVIYDYKTVDDKNRVFIDINGFLHVQNMTKIPVRSAFSRTVTSIMTISDDITKDIDLIALFNIYKTYYYNKVSAIKYFMIYLKVYDFFTELLTEKELLCLLWMKKDRHYQSVAKSLFLSPKTVEYHISNIISKLKNNTISDVLVYLRDL